MKTLKQLTGYIYKITGNGTCYIGMTTQKDPVKRLKQHQANYEKWKRQIPQCRSAYCLGPGSKFEVLETRKIQNRKELFRLEKSYINSLECVNVGSGAGSGMILRSGKMKKHLNN